MLNLNFQDGQAPALNARNMNAIVESINTLGYAVGGPNVASTVSAMTDTSKVYVYTGSETGYTAGNWYYYNGSAWVSGGVYQATAVETDTTLTMPGEPADAKATGDAVTELKSAINVMNEVTALDMLSGVSWELGSINTTTGADSWSTTRIRTGYISIPEWAKQINFSCDSGWKYYAVIINRAKTAVTGELAWKTTSNYIDLTNYSSENRAYVRYMLQRTDNTIDIADYIHAYMTTTSKLIDDVVDMNKKQRYSYAVLGTGYNAYINYDTTNGKIIIPRDTVYIDNNADGSNSYKVLNSSAAIEILNVTSASVGSANAILILDISTWQFSVVPYTTALAENKKIVATIRMKTSGFEGILSSPTPWSIDGYPYGIKILPGDVTKLLKSSQYKYATLLTGYNCYIDYDTTNGTITIPRDTIYIDYHADGTTNYKVLNNESGTVISNLSSFGTSALKLILNVSTWEFSVVSYQTALTDDQQLIATIRLKSGNHVGSLSTPTPWSINGNPYGIVFPDIENFTQKTGTIKSINHRGYNTVAPENTLPAFKLSRLNGFEYVETDIQFTSDGVPVCLHDLSINRTARNADGTTISSTINISEITYEQALDYVFCGGKYNTYPTVKIPKYVEFLNLCKAIGLKAYIELKSDAAYTQEQITGLVSTAKRNGMTDSITWISSSTTFLGYVKTADANARIGVISGVAVSATTVSAIEALRTGTNEVFLDIDNSVLTSEGITTCYTNNIPVEVWTINTDSTINGLDAYITGVTSDSKVASAVLYASNIS